MAIFGRGSTHNGRSMPSSRKTQPDIDIEHIPKFHQERIKVHGVMLWRDRHTDTQTDRHTDITNIVVTLACAREPKKEAADSRLDQHWPFCLVKIDLIVG